MSEKLYLWLLGLYPAQFRRDYGAEAIQLVRDRARDERGLFPKIRLWLDLLADLVISLPREYRNVHPALVSVVPRQRLLTVPFFDLLESGSPRPEALCSGALLSVFVLGAFLILIDRSGGSVLIHATRPAIRFYAPHDRNTPSVKREPGTASDALDAAIKLAAANSNQK